MKKIPLTQGKFALVDDEDYNVLSKLKWHLQPNKKKEYAAHSRSYSTKSGGRSCETILMHKFITGRRGADHRDGNGLNNQKHNLRKATASQNNMNKGKMSVPCTSKYKGVSFYKITGKWVASICVKGKRYHLGYFDKEIDAARAYNKAALLYHGNFARLNILHERGIRPDAEN
jgi:hypothetical protein